MNDEIEQMSNIVISARKALYDHGEIDFAPNKYILSITFVFAPKRLACKTVEADSVQTWFKICKQRGLENR